MVDSTRVHGRIEKKEFPGVRFTINDVLPKPVEVLVTPLAAAAENPRLLIHFMGAAYVPMHAASESTTPTVVAAVHLGAGSGINEKPFLEDSTRFTRLIEQVEMQFGRKFERIDVSAFSAGYGAVRAVLPQHADRIDGLLLLDGLHTGYVGNEVEAAKLRPFLDFARRAIAGEKTFLLTHSEVFPGTFASTTETADYLLKKLELPRRALLEWGPMGMQQLSEARAGNFLMMGFAGNSAPDHLDHFHGITEFLAILDNIARSHGVH